MKLEQALRVVSELKYLVRSQPEYEELMKVALRLEGLNRHVSIHASAVVIAPQPLIEVVPIYKSPEGDICTQFDMYSLDDVGLLKMDVLGLRTLTVIEEAARFVRKQEEKFDPDHLPLDDSKTYELLQRGDTVGVFQLESAGMRDLCRRMRPESIEHITALIALYRPGPMDLRPSFLARKEGREPIEPEHPLLEPICRETYGIMIYQEQVRQARSPRRWRNSEACSSRGAPGSTGCRRSRRTGSSTCSRNSPGTGSTNRTLRATPSCPT
jgi:DNA polymerase-3 subunit alpha